MPAFSPTPVFFKLTWIPDMLVVEDAVTDGNKQTIEVLLEEAAEDFSSPDCHYVEEGASHNTTWGGGLFTQHAKSLLPPSSNALALCKLTLLCFAMPI